MAIRRIYALGMGHNRIDSEREMTDITDKLMEWEGTEIICIKKMLLSRNLENRCGCERCEEERERLLSNENPSPSQ